MEVSTESTFTDQIKFIGPQQPPLFTIMVLRSPKDLAVFYILYLSKGFKVNFFVFLVKIPPTLSLNISVTNHFFPGPTEHTRPRVGRIITNI